MKPSQLQPPTLTVNLTKTLGVDAEGNPVIEVLDPIRMRVLTIHEWWEVGTLVPEVAIPLDKDRKPMPQDFEYKSKKVEADNLRSIYRLAAALDLPNSGIEFDDNTLEGRVDTLQTFDPAIILHLYWKLEAQARGGQVNVATDTFRPKR
jgi:hypothetical protein